MKSLDDLLNKLILLKLMKLFKGFSEEDIEEEEPEKTPKERLVELYTNEKEDPKEWASHTLPTKEEKIEEIKLPEIKDKNILLQLEALTKKEEFLNEKEIEIEKNREHLYSQQQQLRSAFKEAKLKEVI